MTLNSSNPQDSPNTTPAAKHVTGAHELLKSLKERIGEHPELEEAIVELESALSFLTIKTGGLL